MSDVPILEMVRDQREYIQQLRAAIRKHRDQKGDDRCWMDDLELYKVLNEPVNVDGLELPPKCEFLESCRRYWDQRQPGQHEATDPDKMTIRQLSDEVKRLRVRLEIKDQ